MFKIDRYALITGSTSGIGKALSQKFAREKVNLILVSRNAQKLRRQAAALTHRYGINVTVVTAQLEKPDAAHMVYENVKRLGRPVHYLVNNAGFGIHGSFFKASLNKQIEMVNVHIICTTALMKLFLPDMVKNKFGRVLNVASTAAYMACPHLSVYAATKAYVLSVSKSVRAELDGTGVTVTTLCPGATHTAFAKKAHMTRTPLFNIAVMSPEAVAEIGYKALMQGKAVVVAGLYNKALVWSSQKMPALLTNAVTKFMLKQ